MVTSIALIRQEQTGSDGGAQAIIDLMLQALGKQEDTRIALLCRKWESQQNIANKVIINPPYQGRKDKQASFNRAVSEHLQNNHFDLIQSHERLSGCHIFRAGDGVHKIWLQQKALVSNKIQQWWAARSPYHKALLAEEKSMFESAELKKVICNSQMVKQEILNNFAIKEEKLTVIYNGIDTQQYQPASASQKQAIRESLHIPENALVFIFSGSGFERKNLATTIKAFSQLTGNGFLLVVGRDKHQQKYEKLAKKYSCDNRVLFAGAQAKQEMPKLYQSADVLVLPTLYDPFPNVILEGFASGLPCITSSACGAVDILPGNQCGHIIAPTDTQALAEAMQSYTNQEKLHAESENARAISTRFSKDIMQEKLLALYSELLSQN